MIKNSIFILAILISSCSNKKKSQDQATSILYDSLELIEDKHYLNEELYTGLVYSNYENGQLHMQSTYKDGIDNGLFKVWNEENTLIEESMTKDGKRHGTYKKYYPDGELHVKAEYSNGLPNGQVQEWYENRNKRMEEIYKNGLLNGSFIHFFENGKKNLEGYYENGKKEGKWINYDTLGIVSGYNTYKNDEHIDYTPASSSL